MMKTEIFICWGSLRNHFGLVYKFPSEFHFLLELFSLGKGMLQGDLRAPSCTCRKFTGELERDFLQGPVVIGQGVVPSNWKRMSVD